MPAAARLTLGEGDTPLEPRPDLAARAGLERLWLKREDLEPSGSHKDRGVAYQLSALRAADPELSRVLISSSGNAAISAARYGRAAGIEVLAFVAPRTAPGKIERLRAAGARVILSSRALSLAAELAAATGLPNLRPSTDPLAIEGFQSLGWELAEAFAPPAPALFTFVSSATSFVGIGRARARAEALLGRPWAPALHAVQGTGAHPVAGEYDPRPDLSAEERARRGRVGDLGARKTRRVGEAKRLILASGGAGWVVTDAEADEAAAWLRAEGVTSSLEGAASLAAAARAGRAGLREAVVVITGAAREVSAGSAAVDAAAPLRLEAREEAIARLGLARQDGA